MVDGGWLRVDGCLPACPRNRPAVRECSGGSLLPQWGVEVKNVKRQTRYEHRPGIRRGGKYARLKWKRIVKTIK